MVDSPILYSVCIICTFFTICTNGITSGNLGKLLNGIGLPLVKCYKCEEPRPHAISHSILFYSILFYSILFYSILFYSVLFCSVLFCCIQSLFISQVVYCRAILFHSSMYITSFYSVLSPPRTRVVHFKVIFLFILWV